MALAAALSALFVPSWAASQQPTQAAPQKAVIHVYPEADDASQPLGILAPGETATPLAETQGSGGSKWYLVKIDSGIVGWIKQTDNPQAKKVETFFKSLPRETFASAVVISSVSSAAAPQGAIMVPVRSTGRSTIVSVTLNGTVSGNLMLDTGASNTVVSRRLASLLSLRPTGSAIVHTVGGAITVTHSRLQSLKLGDAEVTNLPVMIHDFSPDPRFEGLLGMDFLGRYTIGLDVQKQLLVLSPR
jgi:hypothetical protein